MHGSLTCTLPFGLTSRKEVLDLGGGSRGVHAIQVCQYCMFASKHQAGPDGDEETPGANKRAWNLDGSAKQAEGSYLWDL